MSHLVKPRRIPSLCNQLYLPQNRITGDFLENRLTLYDLYSYNIKHNEKNGWDNTDGDNNGNSWNCGVEGETDDPEIEKLRRRMLVKLVLAFHG